MKHIVWLGNTIKNVRSYSAEAKAEIGYNLEKVQCGKEPSDWKPMISIGKGVKEIRIHLENEYRIIYVAKFPEAIYVLNAFIKKTQQTTLQDIKLTKNNYAAMLKLRSLL